MLKYDRVLYENRLLSQETKETMFSAARARISGNFEVEQALKLLDRYLRITKGKSKRTEAAVWWLKGQAYELFGNREKAIESYETSLQSDTEFKRSEESLKKLKLKKQM